jgi:Tol biopolymer transport system component
MQGRIRGVVLIAAVAGLALPATASAAYPGSNGRIFFDTGGGSKSAIFSIEPDGSGRERVADQGREPAVSADGRRIVYVKGGDLYTANRSGGDEVQVTDTPVVERQPSFSPSGNKLLFATDTTVHNPGHIFTVRVDGGDRTQLTQSERADSDPEYSPDGNKIVFVRSVPPSISQLFKMDADGGDRQQLTLGEFACDSPTWSPNGSRIAFEGLDGPGSSIFALDPDTSFLERFTFSELHDVEPAYAPSGNKIVFRGERDNKKGLFIVGADNAVEQLTVSEPGHGVGVDGDPYWGPTP